MSHSAQPTHPRHILSRFQEPTLKRHVIMQWPLTSWWHLNIYDHLIAQMLARRDWRSGGPGSNLTQD